MALWEIPNRMASTAERSVGALTELPRDLHALQSSLTSIDATLRAALAALVPLREDTAAQLAEVNARLGRLEALIAHIDEQIPDPDAPSPIAKAKDALLGQDDDQDG